MTTYAHQRRAHRLDPAGHLRVGDHERDAAITALGDHFVAGRLSREELAERQDAAGTARTRADLDVLFSDLPVPGAPAAPRVGAARAARTRGSASRPASTHPLLWTLLVALAALLVLTHLPVVLLAVLLWVVLVPRRRRVATAVPRRW